MRIAAICFCLLIALAVQASHLSVNDAVQAVKAQYLGKVISANYMDDGEKINVQLLSTNGDIKKLMVYKDSSQIYVVKAGNENISGRGSSGTPRATKD